MNVKQPKTAKLYLGDSMNVYEEKLYCRVKSIFFELLTNDVEDMIDEIANKGVLSLQKELKLKGVTFYHYYHWSNVYIPKASTVDMVKRQPDLFFVSDDMFKDARLSTKHICHYSFTLKKESSQSFIIPMFQTNQLIGVLQFDIHHDQIQFSDELLQRIGNDFAILLKRAKGFSKRITEENRYEQLFRVTAKFHSSMNMDDVLEEIIHTLKAVFPMFSYYLLLSHDNHCKTNLPIKILQYDNNSSNIAAIQSYVTGSVQLEESINKKRSILYVPLKGNQGVYGVLRVIAPLHITFPDDEINFISLLASTAGKALENAQLYQQSKRLIHDLRLINETTHQLNSDLRLNEVINFVSNQIMSSFEATEVGFILFGENGETPLSGSTSYFFKEQAKRYIQLVKSKITTEKDSLFIGDVNGDCQLNDLMYRSLMAVPMVQNGNVKGVAIVLHRDTYFFSFETFKLLQSLIHHTTLAFSNSILREELEKLVITDYLTNLHSRNYLDDKIQLSMRHDQFGSFILIDIDDFKQINDKYGHQVGDDILILISQLIKSNIRDTDIGARWGGEELAIYLPKVEIEKAEQIAERLVQKVNDESNPKVTISCGISYWEFNQKDSICSLFKQADEALYKAKNLGKNRVVVHNTI